MNYVAERQSAQLRLARARRHHNEEAATLAARDFAFNKIAALIADIKAEGYPSPSPTQRRELRSLVASL